MSEVLIPIDDGYTETQDVKPYGKRPGFSITYRPALFDAVTDYRRAPKTNGKETKTAVLTLLKKHLVSWTITAKGADGDAAVPINDSTLSRVAPVQLEQMIEIVTGYTEAQQETDLKN